MEHELETISRLKFISRISFEEKINVKNMTVQPNTYFTALSRMFYFCFVCHHSAAAWASSPAHSASGGREFLLQQRPTQTPALSVSISHVCPHITLSVCLSRQNGRGVWLTLWVVTGSRQQLWGVSPASRDCRAGIVLRAGRLPPTDWSGRDYCPADPARHSPALPPPHNR